MKTKGKITKKKISITLNIEIYEKLENDLTNKSALINRLLQDHYGNKKM